MLSQAGRHVSRGARPVVQMSFIHGVGRRYSAVTPVPLLEELTQRGFIHNVTRYGPLIPLSSFLMLGEVRKSSRYRSSLNAMSYMQA